jgi:hypothetical protein
MATYSVSRRDGEYLETGLTLEDAAHRILTDDGCEYELREMSDREGFELWSRQQVANIGWRKTHWFSLEHREPAAWAEIAAEVVGDSQGTDWRGLVAWEE